MTDIFTGIVTALEQPLVKQVFWAVAIGVITVITARITAQALQHILSRDSNPLPSSSIIVNIARAAIWIIGGSIILDACFGINANALVTALGVGGIAVSLGFQDTLSNLIGGLQVTFMGIVRPGDNIEVGAEAGVVQDVTWRHTTIRDSLGQTVIIPNSVISKTALVHLLPPSRVVVPFAVPRGQELGGEASSIEELTDRVTELARTAARSISPVIDGPRVLLSEIGEFGIKGKVILQIEDAAQTSAAADVIVRAIAAELG